MPIFNSDHDKSIKEDGDKMKAVEFLLINCLFLLLLLAIYNLPLGFGNDIVIGIVIILSFIMLLWDMNNLKM